MKTSRPRIFSLILTNVSSSGNAVTVASPSGTPPESAIRCARGRFALPEKIFNWTCDSTTQVVLAQKSRPPPQAVAFKTSFLLLFPPPLCNPNLSNPKHLEIVGQALRLP